MMDPLTVFFVFQSLIPLILSSGPQPSLKLEQGFLKGKYEVTLKNRKISSFLGIPYAEPPVANRRFEPPVAASKWTGTLNATTQPPECLQFSHLTYSYDVCKVTGSEDCLYLNVFTPKTVVTGSRLTVVGKCFRCEDIISRPLLVKRMSHRVVHRIDPHQQRPEYDVLTSKTFADSSLHWKLFDGSDTKLMDVIVYIHPGTFMYFSSAYSSPGILLDRDVVLVTFNYRLGVLGFLSTGDNVVPGNNGLKDQVLALKWIRKNIEAFGGDPDRVTIAGLDAGAASAHYHILSPLSKGLFKHAISASGSALCPWSIAENVREKSGRIANQLGCPTADSKAMVECLKNRPAFHIVGFSEMFMPWLYNPYTPFGPVIEPNGPTAFITDSPLNIIKKGKANDVPWLVSFTSEQGLYPAAEFLGTSKYVEEMEDRWEELLPHLLDFNYTVPAGKLAQVSRAIKDHYRVDFKTKEGKQNFIQMFSDRLYMQGITQAAKLHATHYKSPVYLLKFSYSGQYSVTQTLTKFRPVERFGVCHGDDTIYLLPMPWFNLSDQADMSMSLLLRDTWLGFTSKGKVGWPSVNDNHPELSILDIKGPNNLEQTVTKDYSEDEFWKSLDIKDNPQTNRRDEL